VFGAFAHVYQQGKGAVLKFEAPNESPRLKRLEAIARAKNPRVKVLITLGWGHHDWTFIAKDYANRANLFVPSVIAFLRANDLDGFDIDDEGIGREDTGVITQPAFDAVIARLRSALNQASKADKRTYALVITPAGDNDEPGGIDGTQIDAANARSFDWVNIQTYWDSTWSLQLIATLKKLHYPAKAIAVGVNTEGCTPEFPPYNGLKGIFNWTMSADSACHFKYTLQIAKDVGY
jgi:chitinase